MRVSNAFENYTVMYSPTSNPDATAKCCLSLAKLYGIRSSTSPLQQHSQLRCYRRQILPTLP